MIQRLSFALIFLWIGATSQLSCTENISDCPSQMCVMAGGWRLTEVFVDDVKDNSDFSQYQLMLNSPDPASATISDFNRTQPSGSTDSGVWSVENNDTILRLIPDNNPLLTEDWQIESFTLRKLVLVLTRDASAKGGPSKIKFVLEPF